MVASRKFKSHCSGSVSMGWGIKGYVVCMLFLLQAITLISVALDLSALNRPPAVKQKLLIRCPDLGF